MGTLVDEVLVSDVQSILLRPRPFATSSGRFILLPLLPQRPATKPLPTEIWTRILSFVFAHYDRSSQQSSSDQSFARMKLGLVLICKTLKVRIVDIAVVEESAGLLVFTLSCRILHYPYILRMCVYKIYLA